MTTTPDPPQPPPDAVVAADTALEVARFVERWVADRAEGRTGGLHDYLAAFPGAATAVARCLAQLETLPEPKAETSPDAAFAADASDVGPYRLLREIGRGGQAVVYLAEDRKVGRRVALKLIDGGGPFFAAALHRMRREASVVARLDHPALCAVFDAGVDRGRAFIAMRFVEGVTLAARLQVRKERGGNPDRDEVRSAVRFVAAAARALHAAHEAGVVHRDVKPGNLMLAADGAPVVLDFGLAHDAEAAGPSLTATGDVCGTPAYMAPEQLRGAGASRPDRRIDVFALGATLYEAITLRRAFDGPTRAAVLDAVVNREPRDAARLNPAVGRDLAVVTATALAKEPLRRYATAADFADDLERTLRCEPVRARPAGPFGRAWRFARRNPVVAALSAALVVGLAGFAWSTSSKNRELSAQAEETTRLGDVKLVKDLAEWDDRLWPVAPELVGGPDGLDAWSAVADAALARRPLHRAALARVAAAESRSVEYAPGSAAGRATETAWRRELLQGLLRDLDGLEKRAEDVRRRRRECGEIAGRTLVAPRADWDRAAAEVVADPRFAGFVLKPQLGLVPLGRDPASGLQEFADVRTGDVPKRDAASGALAFGPEHGIVYVLLPGGSFTMGAVPPDDDREEGEPNVDPFASRFERPLRTVRLDPFFMGKYETTTAQARRFVRRLDSAPPDGFEAQPLFPATLVTWTTADVALRRVGGELPTEAQWEYAARAGSAAPWWTGATSASLQGAANVADRAAARGGVQGFDRELFDSYAGLSPAGRFRANPFGLHDVYGNAAEWCRDELLSYEADPRDGDGFRSGQGLQPRVHRGGAFDSVPRAASSATRNGLRPGVTQFSLGFRASRRVE